MKLLAFTGLKRAGKSTLANLILKQLKERHNLEHVYHINFADALKKEVAVACGVDTKTIEDNKDVFRTILQWWGTEFKRVFKKNDDYWIVQWLNVLKLKENDAIILCSDVRFDNEAKAITYVGGSVIQIMNSTFVPRYDAHVSEAGINSNLIKSAYNNDQLKGLAQLDQFATELINTYKLNIT